MEDDNNFVRRSHTATIDDIRQEQRMTERQEPIIVVSTKTELQNSYRQLKEVWRHITWTYTSLGRQKNHQQEPFQLSDILLDIYKRYQRMSNVHCRAVMNHSNFPYTSYCHYYNIRRPIENFPLNYVRNYGSP